MIGPVVRFVLDTVKWFDQNITMRSANGVSVSTMTLVRAATSAAKISR